MIEGKRKFILENLGLSNVELSNATGLSVWKIKYYLRASGITRTNEQRESIMAKNGERQTGTGNPNFKGGISSDNYHYKKIQMERFPEKIEARKQVMLALKKGILKKQPCEECRSVKSEAHHPDHLKPLEVVWLCRPHHREREKLESLKRNDSALETVDLRLALY
jgi:hypothetical protein